MSALHDLLIRSADRTPDHPLFIDAKPHASLRYAEAQRQAASVAGALRAAGVERGDRVALLLPDRPESLVATYGILEAGAVVVPLSPDARARPLARLLRRCQARAVITTARNSRLLDQALGELPELRLIATVGAPFTAAPVPQDAPGSPAAPGRGASQAAESQIAARENLEVVPWQALLAGDPWTDAGIGEDDLASIMFTSGTTAAPKGVMTSHGNQLAATAAIVEYLELQPDERMAMVLPFFYSYGLSVLHTHVAVGGTLCLVGSVAFPAAVLRGIEQHRCTGLSGVPSTFARLARSKLLDRHDLTSLRYLTQAGGPMTPALTREVLDAFPGARLFVMYGQTEAAPRLSYLSPDDLLRKLGSVGKAMPTVTLAVLDAEGGDVPVPSGEVGELVARGPNIMRGYWDDAEETARALRPEGLRTGDLARVDAEGFVTIVGRQSDMIKAGAHRVGPQEIEAAIERMAEVAQCGVVGVPDELDGEAIAAYVVPTPGAGLTERAIQRACFEELPRYKLPTHIRLVADLPRTNTGKLRRAELRDWFAREHAAPGSPEKG